MRKIRYLLRRPLSRRRRKYSQSSGVSPVAKDSQQPSFDSEGSGYDYDTARKHGMKPDETGHWSSREPKTGQILKGRTHKTYGLTEQGERDAGHEIYQGKDLKYYSRPKKKK